MVSSRVGRAPHGLGDVSSSPDAPALTVDRARPDDFARIGQLTSGVYVDGGLASRQYGEQLRDVAGRADRAELLVARDDAGRVVGSVALVLAGDFGEVTESDDEAAFGCSSSIRPRRDAGSASSW